MEIKNFKDYLFRLAVLDDLFLSEDISKGNHVENLIKKLQNKKDISFQIMDDFAVNTRDYLSVLIETNQPQVFERIKISLINKLKDFDNIVLKLNGYNSFSDGVLKNTLIKKHLSVKFMDVIQYKLLLFLTAKNITDLIFNDIIFNKSEIIDAQIKFDDDLVKYITPNTLNLKIADIQKEKMNDSSSSPFKKSINNIDCPEWMTLEGFDIFNKFLENHDKLNQSQLSFIIKKLIDQNQVSRDNGYSDNVYTYWLLEKFNIEISKVRSLKESSSIECELIYLKITNNQIPWV